MGFRGSIGSSLPKIHAAPSCLMFSFTATLVLSQTLSFGRGEGRLSEASNFTDGRCCRHSAGLGLTYQNIGPVVLVRWWSKVKDDCQPKGGVDATVPRACCVKHFIQTLRPQIGRDYPLNLSILLSGGKETNKDFPSNGE